MVRSASGPSPVPHRRCRNKAVRHHSHLPTIPLQGPVPTATQVERKFVVLLLLAITGTRRYEIVKKKSQLKGPKRQGKGKLVLSADEGKVESTQDHLCKNDVDFLSSSRIPTAYPRAVILQARSACTGPSEVESSGGFIHSQTERQ